jgi:hypothetical protein
MGGRLFRPSLHWGLQKTQFIQLFKNQAAKSNHPIAFIKPIHLMEIVDSMEVGYPRDGLG